jgi:hypothetical protein
VPSPARRLAAAAVVLGLGLTGMALLQREESSAGGTANPSIADHAEPVVPPEPDVHLEADEAREEPVEQAPLLRRPWLRSLSTAPTRPRLAVRIDDFATTGVDTHLPLIRVDDPVLDGLEVVRRTDGVAAATSVLVGSVPARVGDTRRELDVAFVRASEYRAFTPRITATSDPVWDVLEDDGIVLDKAAVWRLLAGPGSDVSIGRLLRRSAHTIGASASLGNAGVADAVMSDTSEVLPGDARETILVAPDSAAAVDVVVERLVIAGVGDVRRLPPPEPYRAELVGADPDTVAAFEPFTFHPRGGGQIAIDAEWVDRHIETVQLPVLGEARCHRLLVPQLRAALEEIVERGLDEHLDPRDFGGCWMPRHISWDDSRELSMHAWGLAFDVNVSTNPYGETPQLDPEIVRVFEEYGFNWGGRWRTPDGMHFELGRLIDLSSPG